VREHAGILIDFAAGVGGRVGGTAWHKVPPLATGRVGCQNLAFGFGLEQDFRG
jgi:hypothetical protein